MVRVPHRLFRACAGALLILALGAGPILADTGPAGDFSFSRTGLSAIAFSGGTCVDNADATTTCSYSSLDLFAGKTHQTGTAAIRGTEVCVSTASDTITTLTRDFISSTSEDGCTTNLAPGSVIFNDLSGATLSTTTITVQGQTCDSVPTCVPTVSRPVVVAGTWTGVGDASFQRSRFFFSDGICTFRDSFKGLMRQATFSGTIDIVPFEADFVQLIDGSQSFSQRCKGPA